jgi:hypothetical protein
LVRLLRRMEVDIGGRREGVKGDGEVCCRVADAGVLVVDW